MRTARAWLVVVFVLAAAANAYSSSEMRRIAWIKANCRDGDVVCAAGVVTAELGWCFYLQDHVVPGKEQEPVAGIRVIPAGPGPYPVPVAGNYPWDLTSFFIITEEGDPSVYMRWGCVVSTDPDGERTLHVLPGTRILGCTAEMPAPLCVCNRYLGGCNCIGQKGVCPGYGPNNVGMLVQTSGMVMACDPSAKSFYIDDGTVPFTGAGRWRIRVSYADVPGAFGPPRKYAWVRVNGVCGIYLCEGKLRPVIRLGRARDLSYIPKP